VRSEPLFSSDGLGTPFLFSQWRRKAPRQPIQAGAVLVKDGAPTVYFASLWRGAFPSRDSLPDQIAMRDGTGTDAFWEVFE